MAQTTDKHDISQITVIMNKKTLAAACDALELANIERDKSPAGIHGKYSRIKLCVFDFSKNPSILLNFYLKPTEIRRLYWQARVVKGNKEYSVAWQKKKERKNMVVAECMVIAHEPWMDKEKKTLSRYPWKIGIATGEYKNGSSKPVYDKRAEKRLSDDEFEDFLCAIVTYLNAWETIAGAPLLKEIKPAWRIATKKRMIRPRKARRRTAGQRPIAMLRPAMAAMMKASCFNSLLCLWQS